MGKLAELCTEGWERNLPQTGRQVAQAVAAQREAEHDWAFARVKAGDELLGLTAVECAAYNVRVNALRRAGEVSGHDYQLALTWARAMAASIADNQERAMVEQVIEAHRQCRKMPSWGTMTGPMQAAVLALDGKTRPWKED